MEAYDEKDWTLSFLSKEDSANVVRSIRAVLRKMAPGAHLHDLEQATYLQLLVRFRTGAPTVSWAGIGVRIATRLAIKSWRTERRYVTADLTDLSVDGNRLTLQELLASIPGGLEAISKGLRRKSQRTILRMWAEGLSIEAMAQRVGKTKEATEKILRRLAEKLGKRRK